jgi:hypothetical protein
LAAKFGKFRLHRIVGRCRGCRKVLVLFRRARERIAGASDDALLPLPTTKVDGVSPARSVERIRQRGYCTGYNLSLGHVAAILRYAQRTPCVRGRNRFKIGEVRNGRSPDGRFVPVADVDTSYPCRALDEVAHDATLVETARKYLSYSPTQVLKRLYWSPASDIPDDVRRSNGQTVDFHYDIEESQSLYVYFYITGANAASGAHVVIPDSHRSKPLPIALSSCFQSEERLSRYYPHRAPVTIEGGPGFGFAEDPACFHKVLAPAESDRLILQLRYS